MKIWLVSIFEQTPVDNVSSTRFINIANSAIRSGHAVDFFASTFKHNTKIQRYKSTTVINKNHDYTLYFIKSIAYRNNISLARLYSHHRYAKKLVSYLDGCEVPDIVFIGFPPISLSYELIKWASTRKIPVVVDIIDPWPDLFERPLSKFSPSIRKLLLGSLRCKVSHIVNGASAITSISNQYLTWANKYGTSLKSKCFYPAVDFKFMTNFTSTLRQKEEHIGLKIIYAGSLASSYDIETILGAAQKLLNIGEIQFIIAGSGPKEKQILDYTSKYHNVEFLGRLPKDDLLREYAKCDLGLTQHVKGATQSVTYKLFDLLACGLPILNSLESEMKDILLNNRVGMHNDPGDIEGLVENIMQFFNDRSLLEEYRLNAFRLTAEKGDADVVYGELVHFLEEVVEVHD